MKNTNGSQIRSSVKMIFRFIPIFEEKKIVQVNNKSGINEIKGYQEQITLN